MSCADRLRETEIIEAVPQGEQMDRIGADHMAKAYVSALQGQEKRKTSDKDMAEILGEKLAESREAEDEIERYQKCEERNLRKDKSDDDYWERRIQNKKRLKKYIAQLQEKKLMQRKAIEKAVVCERIEHQKMLSVYWEKRALEESVSPSVLARRKVQPKIAAASYETSFMIKDPKV